MQFYLRGAAKGGEASLTVRDDTVRDKTLIQVPHFSSVGVVRAPVTSADSDNVSFKIVVADAEPQDDRVVEERTPAQAAKRAANQGFVPLPHVARLVERIVRAIRCRVGADVGQITYSAKDVIRRVAASRGRLGDGSRHLDQRKA